MGQRGGRGRSRGPTWGVEKALTFLLNRTAEGSEQGGT